MKIAVQHEDFDLSTEVAALRANQPQIGAIASFVGLVRDINDGSSVAAMSLEHYPAMTEKALRAIAAEAAHRWQIIDTTIIHRIGDLYPSDQIVLVAVASMHHWPDSLAQELGHLRVNPRIWITHLKPGKQQAIMAELRRRIPGHQIAQLVQGQVIEC